MVCPRCYGPGSVYAGREGWQPCPECHGSGIVSCCDTAGAGRDSASEGCQTSAKPEKAAGAPSEGQQTHIGEEG